MKINSINNINFKKNYFGISKYGKFYELHKIATDNEENLGKEPVLQYERFGEKYEFPMMYDGKYYATQSIIDTDKYRIYYKDTGKYERNGEEQVIDPLYYIKIATKADRKYNNLPMEHALAKGITEGQIIAAKNVYEAEIPLDKPVILVLDEVKKEEEIILDCPKNVRGIIVASGDMDHLDHAANLTRNNFHLMSIIWDEDKFNELKEQNGKYLSVNNKNGLIEYSEVKPSQSKEIKPTEKAVIPKLENTEKLLTFDELTPQNCGNKGYRLGVMQKLVNEGKLKGISIPKGFVIPEGYINKVKEYIGDVKDEEYEDKLYDGIYSQEVDKKVEELGMDKRNLIVRSNYNTEDLGSFSSAGIYHSRSNWDSWLLPTTLDVLEKSERSDLAQFVHKKYGIDESQIQPSVIVQDEIDAQYVFTAYSDDGNKNTIIELSDFYMGHLKPAKALIKYNKETKELTLEHTQNPLAQYLLDENGQILDVDHGEDMISDNWDKLEPLLEVVTSNAEVLEDYFNHPQDIEGGITNDGKVYFWQTRDIVAKEVEKI